MNEKNSKVWIKNIQGGKDTYREKHLSPYIQKYVKGIPSQRSILDIGCGTGEGVVPFLKKPQRYLGIDPSPELLRNCAQRFNIQFYEPQSMALMGVHQALNDRAITIGTFPQKAKEMKDCRIDFFDELLCVMVLHYSNDLPGFLDSAISLLKPKGGHYLFISFNSEKRQEIESFFKKINYREGISTRGDYVLPNGGVLKNTDINFHENKCVLEELSKMSTFVREKTLGGIFKIFEGVKK